MSNVSEVKSIIRTGYSEVVEKKSRFLGEAWPVSSVEETEEILNSIRKKYYDARHHVFAYRIGENAVEKASDDGEPSRTAGFPILSILKNENITNVMVVVTRYFGGTLLGTGGLVRAYSLAAQQAVADAGILMKEPFARYRIPLDYTMLGKVQYMLNEHEWPILDTEYADKVVLKVMIPEERCAAFEKEFTDLVNGTVTLAKPEYILAARLDGAWQIYE